MLFRHVGAAQNAGVDDLQTPLNGIQTSGRRRRWCRGALLPRPSHRRATAFREALRHVWTESSAGLASAAVQEDSKEV